MEDGQPELLPAAGLGAPGGYLPGVVPWFELLHHVCNLKHLKVNAGHEQGERCLGGTKPYPFSLDQPSHVAYVALLQDLRAKPSRNSMIISQVSLVTGSRPQRRSATSSWSPQPDAIVGEFFELAEEARGGISLQCDSEGNPTPACSRCLWRFLLFTGRTGGQRVNLTALPPDSPGRKIYDLSKELMMRQL